MSNDCHVSLPSSLHTWPELLWNMMMTAGVSLLSISTMLHLARLSWVFQTFHTLQHVNLDGLWSGSMSIEITLQSMNKIIEYWLDSNSF